MSSRDQSGHRIQKEKRRKSDKREGEKTREGSSRYSPYYFIINDSLNLLAYFKIFHITHVHLPSHLFHRNSQSIGLIEQF